MARTAGKLPPPSCLALFEASWRSLSVIRLNAPPPLPVIFNGRCDFFETETESSEVTSTRNDLAEAGVQQKSGPPLLGSSWISGFSFSARRRENTTASASPAFRSELRRFLNCSKCAAYSLLRDRKRQ